MPASSDFEVHAIGTAKELRLSRALCHAIESLQHQYPNTIPQAVLDAYQPLKRHHAEMLALEQSHG